MLNVKQITGVLQFVNKVKGKYKSNNHEKFQKGRNDLLGDTQKTYRWHKQ